MRDGGDAHLRGRAHLPWPTMSKPLLDNPSAQRRPMRMLQPGLLVLVDLPVDVVVVLEQQERAGKASRTERALRKLRCSRRREHVFAR
jgi:hypothetical protein